MQKIKELPKSYNYQNMSKNTIIIGGKKKLLKMFIEQQLSQQKLGELTLRTKQIVVMKTFENTKTL